MEAAPLTGPLRIQPHFDLKHLEAKMVPTRASKPHPSLEDPLAYLPCSLITEYQKGQVIYGQNEPSTSIYLVLDGKVKVFRFTEEGRQVLVSLCQTDDFFGESGFLHLPQRPEGAVALENTKLMTWTAAEVEGVILRQPRLGFALVQMLAQRTMEFTRRIESFSTEYIARRLARCLISFSERMGIPQEDGSVNIGPFTHELLSEYVGTTREIVTHNVIEFRKQGYLRYSRKGIILQRDFHDSLHKAPQKPASFAPREPTL
jgi:CRP-like cAMP-binding protein